MSGQVVIVGAGVTGLAAAHTLNAAVADGRLASVTLLESSARLGGKVLTERLGGFLLEGGPDSFLTLRPQAITFARSLGLGDRLVGTLAPRHVFILHRGRLEPLPDGLAGLVPTRLGPFLQSRLFSPLQKARIAAEVLVPPDAHGTDESLAAFVRRRLGPAAVERLAGPLLAGIHAGDVEQLSLRATFPQLAEAERRYGSLTRAVLARRGAASVGGSAGLFMTLAGGLQEMVDAAAADLSCVTVRTQTPVLTIGPRRGGFLIRVAGGEEIPADQIILAVPAGAAAALLQNVNPASAAVARSIPYVSTAVVALGFRRRDVGHPLAGHGYLVTAGERCLHTACTWVSSKWGGRAPDGHVLLRCFVGRAGDQEALALGDDALTSALLEELEPVLRVTGAPVLARTYRWEHAMPQYVIGHLDRVAALMAALANTPGLIVTGAGFGGVGIPDCIRQGTAAAAQVLAARRSGALV